MEPLKQVVANPPRWLIVLGNAPVTADALRNLRSLGMRCINYSTDDPWNPAHRAAWHLEALPIYDAIFSTRRSNMDDFKRLGCVDVRYLPFAYDERLFGPPVNPPPEAPAPETVLFVGGADRDRAAFFSAFLRYGPPPTLVGGYWERYAHTRPLGIGQKTAAELRCLTAGAAVNLCLVRRANRDGHVMRTFEIAALGGCMVVEDTQEHREILGPDGECVVYFRTHEEAAGRVIALLEWPAERQRLSAAVQKRVVSGANTYADRLKTMLADLEALIAVKRAFE